MRAFIAIDLPDGIRTVLGQKQADFHAALTRESSAKPKRESDVRWTRPEGIHLTLKFLGEITERQVKQVSESLSSFKPFAAFSVEVKGFGFFPGAARPRVLWAGVQAPQELVQLAREVEVRMEKSGFPREQRAFNPHLTLARFNNPGAQPTLRALVEQQVDVTLGRFEITQFYLFESKLSPRGAEYRKVARFPL
jgi:2'-5' RNA ligase